MAQSDMTWGELFRQESCFDFLLPVAEAAAKEVASLCPDAASLCPDAASLLDEGAIRSMGDVCLRRLEVLYERPILRLVILEARSDSLAPIMGGAGPDAPHVRAAATRVGERLVSDGGAALRSDIPLATASERSIVRNFVESTAEMLQRLLRFRGEVSDKLLGGQPITRVLEISQSGSDLHRHGRAVTRILSDAGAFYYKPHDCSLDLLMHDLSDALLPGAVRVARVVPGEGFAFVEELVPEEPEGEEGLREYWRNLGRVTALFHGLGSRDMTCDNLMCCGDRPAVLDVETLLVGDFDRVGAIPLDEEPPRFAPVGEYEGSVLCTGVLASSARQARVMSPLFADPGHGGCLPRVGGEARTVEGFEEDFLDGFIVSHRNLTNRRDEALGLIRRYENATCRHILLNTWAYDNARMRLFSPGALSDSADGEKARQEVRDQLRSAYGIFPDGLGTRAVELDMAALAEGDIPYYCTRLGGREVFADSISEEPLGSFLMRSPLENAEARLGRLSERELRFEECFIGSLIKAAVVGQTGAGSARELLSEWRAAGGRLSDMEDAEARLSDAMQALYEEYVWHDDESASWHDPAYELLSCSTYDVLSVWADVGYLCAEILCEEELRRLHIIAREHALYCQISVGNWLDHVDAYGLESSGWPEGIARAYGRVGEMLDKLTEAGFGRSAGLRVRLDELQKKYRCLAEQKG